MTIELSLAPRAQCTEVHGTAITVGVDPSATESRVSDEYVTAATAACDPATRAIGTLVITPGDSDSASVVVVVAYDQRAASACKPPAYKGCIVARRRFTFAAHTRLAMPITIDPDCKDVPCDAFSTCRTGVCFDSSVSCSGDACNEPGATPDGGTSEAGVVTPDASFDGPVPDGALDGALDGASDGASDGALDGATDGAAESGVDASIGTAADCNYLDGDSLVCGGGKCDGVARSCCGLTPPSATCSGVVSVCAPQNRYCCKPSDCLLGKACNRGPVVLDARLSRSSRLPNPFGSVGTCAP